MVRMRHWRRALAVNARLLQQQADNVKDSLTHAPARVPTSAAAPETDTTQKKPHSEDASAAGAAESKNGEYKGLAALSTGTEQGRGVAGDLAE